MIAKTRTVALNVVGLALSLVAGLFAVSAVTQFLLFFYRVVFGGSFARPLILGIAAAVMAVVMRFVAELDQFEYVAPKTTTTTRRTSGSPRSRTTRTTTKTSGGTK